MSGNVPPPDAVPAPAQPQPAKPAPAPLQGVPRAAERALPQWLQMFRPLFAGIGCRPLLLAAVAVIFLLAWPRGPAESLGAPSLFWHEHWLTQFGAGLGVGVLFAEVCFVGFLLDSDEVEAIPDGAGLWRPLEYLMSWIVPDPKLPDPKEEEACRTLRWYLCVSWLPLLLLFVGAALIGDVTDPLPGRGAFAAAGLLAAVVLVATFVRVFRALRSSLGWAGNWVFAGAGNWKLELTLHAVFFLAGLLLLLVLPLLLPTWRMGTMLWCFFAGLWVVCHATLVFLFRVPVQEKDRWKHLRGGAAFGALFLIYEILFIVYWTGGGFWISPALVLCLLLCLVVLIHGFLRFHFRGWYVLASSVLLGLVGLIYGLTYTFCNFDTLRFDGLDYAYEKPVELDKIDFQSALEKVGAKPEWSDDNKLDYLKESYTHLWTRYRNQVQAETGEPCQSCPAPPPEDAKSWEDFAPWCDQLREALLKRETDRLDKWQTFAAKDESNPRPVLVVVAVSGGADRSAYWSALVLDALEQADDLGRFPRHVCVITGASGGMVGASHWAATLQKDQDGHGGGYQVEDAAVDSLTPVAQSIVFTDLPNLLAPQVRDWDRGRALEQSWRKGPMKEFDDHFRDLARKEAEGWMPALILSPTLVEDGRRLLISNRYLPFLTENHGDSRSKERDQAPPESSLLSFKGPTKEPFVQMKRPGSKSPPSAADGGRAPPGIRYSLPALEFFHLFPDAGQFPLGTAVRMSASFPYISPAAELPTKPRRRVVDAGYYDGYGVDLAAGWIHYYHKWLHDHTSGVVLIQVRDSKSSDLLLDADKDSPAWRSLDWLTGPLEGAGSTRGSTMSFRNDEQVQGLNDEFNTPKDPEWFTTVVFECRKDIAMTWRLTNEERTEMQSERNAMKSGNAKGAPLPADGTKRSANSLALQHLREWWEERSKKP